MFAKRLPFFVFAGWFFVLLVGSCRVFNRENAQNSLKEEDSPSATDFYQNLTSSYNILHNAKLMLEKERRAIFDAANKNYQVRLTVFDEPAAKGDPHKDMDSLIQKAYKIVNDKQESKYVDEAYFVIGRAYYMKGSYYTAAEFFDKLIKTPSGFRNYTPQAYAWKSRALLQVNRVEAAEEAIDSAFVFLDKSRKTATFVNAAKANHLIRTGREREAIPFLEYALASNRDRYEGYRWRFLLAQLYRDTGQEAKAQAILKKLSNSNVPFDMAFQANLQAAFLAGKMRGETPRERVKPLRAMLREGKNMDYRDQILYEIGKIYLDSGDEENALRSFGQSLAEVQKSPYQTTETYLTIADHYFGRQQYHQAQAYYDSTAAVLPDDYTDVDAVRRKLAHMSQLTKLHAENLWQDTLIALARLDDSTRAEQVEKYAAIALINRQKEIERTAVLAKKRKKSGSGAANAHFSNNAFAHVGAARTGGGSSAGAFYFNNRDAVLLGESEFKRRWGNRQLKDDWRFAANNSATLPGRNEKGDPAKGTADPADEKKKEDFDIEAFTASEKSRYLESVPPTQEEFDRRQKIIHDNMIAIGNIYRDYTRENRDAIAAYEAFLARFPNTEAGAEIHYSLYRMYDGLDQAKSEEHKARLLALFPNSLHAHMALDPYYMDKLKWDRQRLDRVFEQLFTRYADGDHVGVIEEADRALAGVFEASGMSAQIAYLRTLAIGRVGSVSDFEDALHGIVEKYPTDSLVLPLAKANLAFISENPDLFINRVNALQDISTNRVAFVDEPNMTPWPALHIEGDYRTGVAIAQKDPEKNEGKKALSVLRGGQSAAVGGVNSDAGTSVRLERRDVLTGKAVFEERPNGFRNRELLPDTATYYFVVNVMDEKVNLAPSRYGIGQYNRARYGRSSISHQTRRVNGENQLLFIGTFATYEEAKAYEAAILPMLPEIMKVPQDDYNTFLITREMIGTLTDAAAIDDYYEACLSDL